MDVTSNQVLDQSFWTTSFPGLSIGRAANFELARQRPPHSQTLQRIRDRVMVEGYFGDEDPGLLTPSLALADAVKKCVTLDLPPVFIFMFDETWECFFRLHPVLASLLGADYRLLPDFWTWHVDPAKQESGWKPHRDKGKVSLAEDGSPLSLTVWIPLSDANPLNGCMYVVPANADATYRTPQEKILHVLPTKVRAVPAKPGEYLCWNQALYHWGAPASSFGTEPRISMALEFQRGDIAPFNKPLLEPLKFPDFASRQALIAKQVLQYRHMYAAADALVEIATRMRERYPAAAV
jgi:hypothetical protein